MRRYVALARVPHGPWLIAGWMLVVPGQAAFDLVILLALHHTTGSFGAGGVAVALGTIAFSMSAVLQGRLMGRIGIRRALGLAAIGLALATSGLSASIALNAPTGVLIGYSAAVGLTQPATGLAIRIAWKSVTTDPNTRAAAFSYTTAAQDAGYISGPAIFGFVATGATPLIALICCGALSVAGTLAISWAASGPAQAEVAAPVREGRLLRRMAPVAATMFAFGAAMGAIDVSAPAFANQHGQSSLGGVLLAVCSLGSLLGGLTYGARTWKSPSTDRLFVCAMAFGALLVLPALAPTPIAAAVGLLVAGLPMGATLSTAYLSGGELVSDDRTIDALSILSLALNIGGGLGYVFAAQLAADASAADGFMLAAGAALLAAVSAVRLRVIRPRCIPHG